MTEVQSPWVKCSDRLPHKSEWPEIHYQVDHTIADGVLMDNEDAGIIWFEQKVGGSYKQIEPLSRVSWLDETLLQSLVSDLSAAREEVERLREFVNRTKTIITQVIYRTPTSEWRNLLTDFNIELHHE